MHYLLQKQDLHCIFENSENKLKNNDFYLSKQFV